MLLDPDPHSQYGSDSQTNADPDPQPCFSVTNEDSIQKSPENTVALKQCYGHGSKSESLLGSKSCLTEYVSGQP